MNVALYLRMSSDKQEASIPQQEQALRALCDQRGYRIATIYRDDGISGDATEKRKGFLRMIGDAGKGAFRRIVAWDQDRIGRFDLLEAGFYLNPLRKHGITFETIAQGVVDLDSFAGRITYAVQQEAKHGFLRDLSRNTLRGLCEKARTGNGFYGGPTPYGYRRETVQQGGKSVSSLVVNDAEAEIVRLIFTEYGKPAASCRGVASMLNRRRIPTVRGGESWRPNAVKRILSNRVYIGEMVWGRRLQGKYCIRSGSQILARASGDDSRTTEPFIHRDAVPAIVSPALFDRVQTALIDRQKATRGRASIRPLSGLMVCAKCGRPMHSDNSGFRCGSNSDAKGPEQCRSWRIAEAPILDAVAGRIEAELLDPRRMALVKSKLQRLAAAEQEPAGDGQGLRRRLAGLEKQLVAGVDRLTQVPAGIVAELAKALDGIRQERDAVAAEIAAGVTAKASRRRPEEQAEEMVALAGELKQTLRQGDAVAVNHALARLGVRISAQRNPDRSVEIEVQLAPAEISGDLSPTRPHSGQAPRPKRGRKGPGTGSEGKSAPPPLLTFKAKLRPT